MAGAPNNRFALQSLTEETFKTKLRQGKPPSRMDLGAFAIPLGTTNGTTNAVVFGMGLMSARDPDLNLVFGPPKFFVNHDMDAPPWWYFHKRPTMYIDGFAEKGHRGLMQFTLVPENSPDFYKTHEDNFRDVLAYITSLRPPKYPGHVDPTLASRGKVLFDQTCSKCHGTYGDEWTYPNRRVPLHEIGTDPVRLTALTVEDAGIEAVKRSKRLGLWNFLDDVDALIKPEDLLKAFRSYSGSRKNFEAFWASSQRFMLRWRKLAKTPENRTRRIQQLASLASENRKLPGS